MYSSNPSIYMTILITFLVVSGNYFTACVQAKVRVRVMNRLGDGRSMNVHCQSKDDDLGPHTVSDGCEAAWSFSANFWRTTLFYCDVQWAGLGGWGHFDAYDAGRDSHSRCFTECRWMISADGLLYGYNQGDSNWELFPFVVRNMRG